MCDLVMSKRKEGLVNNKATKVRAIIGGAALGIIILTGVVYLLTSSPSFLFKSLLDKYYKGFSWALENIDENELDINLLQQSITTTGTLDVELDLDMPFGEDDFDASGLINNYLVNYTLGLDLKNRKAEAGIVNFDQTKLLDILFNVKDGIGYASLNGSNKVGSLLDKSVKIDLQELVNQIPFGDVESYLKAIRNSYITAADVDYIAKTLTDLINASFDDVEFEDKKTETIVIDGKSVSVTKNSFILNDKNIKTIVNAVLDGISENNEFIEKVARWSSMSAADFKTYVEVAKEVVNTSGTVDLGMELAIYTTGSFIFTEFVKIAVINEATEDDIAHITNYNDVFKFWVNPQWDSSIPSLKYTKGLLSSKLEVITYVQEHRYRHEYKDYINIYHDFVVLTATIRSNKANNIDVDFVLNLDDSNIYPLKATGKIKMTYVDKTWNGAISLNVLDDDQNADIDFNYNLVKSTDNQYNLSASFAGVFIDHDDYLGSEDDIYNVELSNTSTIWVDKPVATIPSTDAVYWYNLTDANLANLVTKLNESLAGTAIGVPLELYKDDLISIIQSKWGDMIFDENGLSNPDDFNGCDDMTDIYTDGKRYYTYSNNGAYQLIKLTQWQEPRQVLIWPLGIKYCHLFEK